MKILITLAFLNSHFLNEMVPKPQIFITFSYLKKKQKIEMRWWLKSQEVKLEPEDRQKLR